MLNIKVGRIIDVRILEDMVQTLPIKFSITLKPEGRSFYLLSGKILWYVRQSRLFKLIKYFPLLDKAAGFELEPSAILTLS